MSMEYKPNGWTVKVPAGTYFLGDPCYAVPRELWEPLLVSSDFFDSRPVGTTGGREVVAFSTKWGDGQYHDADGTTYGVDAGLIGLVPMELYDGHMGDLDTMGRIVTFHYGITATSDGDGRLEFGGIKIDTSDSREDERW